MASSSIVVGNCCSDRLKQEKFFSTGVKIIEQHFGIKPGMSSSKRFR